MEHLSGLDMGAWIEDGNSAFEAIQQQSDVELNAMVNVFMEKGNEAEGSVSAFKSGADSGSFAGGNESDNVAKELEAADAEKASETTEGTDATDDTDGTDTTDKEQEDLEEAEKRAKHEAVEAKRKAEWEAEQQAKKAAEQEEWKRLESMSDDDVMMNSMKRISEDTERLTRRNLKECLSEHIQTKCLEDPAFARMALHPKKTMVHCFWYVNRKAGEFVEQETKNKHQNPKPGYYGSDVPDALCYQWAEEYFQDMNAPEDKEEGNEDKFIPKPYHGRSVTKSKSKKKAEKKELKEQTGSAGQDSAPKQLSLFELAEVGKAV